MAYRDGLPKILTVEPNFPGFKAVTKMGAEPGDDCIIVNHSEVAEITRNIAEKLIDTGNYSRARDSE